jgi:MazG family protein
VLEAIDAGEPGALRDELGDLLLQVVFHAQLAAEAGRFTIADVATAIADKLVRRHPHVFGDVEVEDAAEVVRNWTRIKQEERRAAGRDADPFAGIPGALPALARAQRFSERAAPLGLTWPDAASVLAKVREETAELAAAVAAGDSGAIEHELGDLLFAVASLAQRLGRSGEMALQAASRRFVARVRHADAAARAGGRTLSDLRPDEIDALWEAAKVAERGDPEV